MSSFHRLMTTGEVEHTNFLSEDIGTLLLSDNYTDVTLIVAGQRFNGHKIILAARSQYFRALLFGGLRESTQREIELTGASLPAFKGLFEYIYTGRLFLGNHSEEVIVDILGLAHQYGFLELEAAISDYLEQILNINNVFFILDVARFYQLEFLTRACHQYMDHNAKEIIEHDNFLQLSPTALIELVSRDSLCAHDIDIFLAIQKWISANPDVDAEEVLEQTGLKIIPVSETFHIVRPTGSLSPETILDVIAASTVTPGSNRYELYELCEL